MELHPFDRIVVMIHLSIKSRVLLVGLVFFGMFSSRESGAEPPYWGTIFIDPDIVTPEDPTLFSGQDYAGRGLRQMFDRRSGWVTLNAFLFDVTFSDGLTAEFQVNPEFGTRSAAEREVERFAPAIGQLPTVLRADMETVWIHQGNNPFGGGNNNILIHTGQAEEYVRDGILEETLIHEAAHTSLDAQHARSDGWLAAQAADPEFISTYARDNPFREDIAESFLTYIAVRHREDRISRQMSATIQNTIPNRLAYFDAQDLDLFPISAGIVGDFNDDGVLNVIDIELLAEQSALGTNDAAFDITDDGMVDGTDVHRWITELANSWIGDANVDGEFNSGDFVQVFTGGKFELNVTATWSEGDWNADGQFDSGDFVAAFTDGGFESGPRVSKLNRVPEPRSVGHIVFISSLVLLRFRRF